MPALQGRSFVVKVGQDGCTPTYYPPPSPRRSTAGLLSCLVLGWAAATLFTCTPAHGDPNPPHTPSYYQGKKVVDNFNRQSPVTQDTPLYQVCQNLATNTQFSGPIANPVDFVRGCVDEGRVLLGLYNRRTANERRQLGLFCTGIPICLEFCDSVQARPLGLPSICYEGGCRRGGLRDCLGVS